MWLKIKENWHFLVVAVVVAGALGHAYMDWLVAKNVGTAFTAAGLVNPADVAANTESIKDLEADADKLDGKVERIIAILIE
jgi:hypothetical protein